MALPRNDIKKTKDTREEPGPNCNLIVRHIPVEWKVEDLHELFQPFGTIESIKIMYDLKENYSKGYGFVCFSSTHEAQNAKAALDGLAVQFPGKKLLHLRVSYATVSMNIGNPSRSIYVRSLKLGSQIVDVWEIFKNCGEIEKIVMDTSNPKKCAAYVTFFRKSDAARAISEKNNVILEEGLFPIYIRYVADENVPPSLPGRIINGHFVEIAQKKKMTEEEEKPTNPPFFNSQINSDYMPTSNDSFSFWLDDE